MGRQVNFYAHPDDVAEMQRKIEAVEPMRILRNRSPHPNPLVDTSLLSNEEGESWLFYYLVREKDLPSVKSDYVSAQGYWVVNEFRSPVVQFNRGYFDGEILRRGRVYYVTGFYDEDDRWVEKDSGFQKWAEKISRRVRSILQRQDGEYVGRVAAAWLSCGKGKFAS